MKITIKDYKGGQEFINKLSLKELRDRQDLNEAQIKLAFEKRDTVTLKHLQRVNNQLMSAVMLWLPL